MIDAIEQVDTVCKQMKQITRSQVEATDRLHSLLKISSHTRNVTEDSSTVASGAEGLKKSHRLVEHMNKLNRGKANGSYHFTMTHKKSRTGR